MQRSNRKHQAQGVGPTPATAHSQNEEYFNFYRPCLFKIQKKRKRKKKEREPNLVFIWRYKFCLLPSVKEHY